MAFRGNIHSRGTLAIPLATSTPIHVKTFEENA